jgi:DNA-binding transcriptional ArsR family regulator
MDVEPSIAPLGALIAVPARANMLSALFDGKSLTASELAYSARVTPQTASSHLAKLVDAKLLVVERHGRFRYYKLAGPDVADALEPLTHISPHRPVPVRGRSVDVKQLRDARFCYDHIAGHLGVLLADAMLQKGLLAISNRDFELTQVGISFCESFGMELEKVRSQRRVFARQCLDWSERRPHLAGSLGAEFAKIFVTQGWIIQAKKSRSITVTKVGRDGFKKAFGILL